MVTDYYSKYIKYKKKYHQLKNLLDKKYILHVTSFPNLVKILNEGIIKLGRDVPKNMRKLGAGDPNGLPYVFARFYFPDISETIIHWNYQLILDIGIMEDYDIIFNNGWSAQPTKKSIYFYPNDSDLLRNKKINKVKNLIKNYNNDVPRIMNHELIFEKEIVLTKYLRAIVLNFDNMKQYNNIKQIITDKYPNVAIVNNLDNYLLQ